MSVLGTSDAPLDIFGGLVTDMAPADLPGGVSPDCQDVAFVPGAVKTRPGLLSVFPAISGNPTLNYLKTFSEPNLTNVLLALDSAGALWGELSPGTLTQINIGNGSFITPGCRAKSATLFGREYLALGDGKNGLDIPRQYDGTFFDRVSQCGPGRGPASVFDAAAEPALTIAASPSGAVRSNSSVTITVTSMHGYLVGQVVTIAGVTDASFDGTFTVASVPSATSFTYLQTGASATSGSGTATLVPQISAGTHQVAVMFVTRQGYITAPSPPVSWQSQGGRRVTLFGLPFALLKTNVVARIVAFTTSGGDSFYYTTGANNTTRMLIPDNSTTNVTLDFSDTALLAGTLADPLFDLVELGECAGVIGYASRLFWWGERNKIGNFLNLTFDGGWNGNTPLGCTSDITYGLGTLRDFSSIRGGCLDLIGDGSTPIVGLIYQNAAVDSYGASTRAPNASSPACPPARPRNPIAFWCWIIVGFLPPPKSLRSVPCTRVPIAGGCLRALSGGAGPPGTSPRNRRRWWNAPTAPRRFFLETDWGTARPISSAIPNSPTTARRSRAITRRIFPRVSTMSSHSRRVRIASCFRISPVTWKGQGTWR